MSAHDITCTEPICIAIIAWSQMDLLDFAGPCEVFLHVNNNAGERLCTMLIAAENQSIPTPEGVIISRDIDMHSLNNQLQSFDVLLCLVAMDFPIQTHQTCRA
ncbi:hypothetical protein K431DRAFT_282034 [Polychaeton citri CBS 116435]|uniref:Uncharacterized protein n=1 Tax=Polychaeton citri CBS 116435 TaxID=1314669 RepID=A0A9P4QH16_9PEZI|nr:hypothetical protein K431DRAFT_282034 [Polychaeton citri CBS 116435]